MLDVDSRFKLKEWKSLSGKEQFAKIEELSLHYSSKVSIIKVQDQAIEIDLHIDENRAYEFLVEYERYLREALGSFPIIVLLGDRKDENKKRA